MKTIKEQFELAGIDLSDEQSTAMEKIIIDMASLGCPDPVHTILCMIRGPVSGDGVL